jgi:hypothetical protein
MTDDEYRAEWPFCINDAEVRLVRTPPHTLEESDWDRRQVLLHQRTKVDLWLGKFTFSRRPKYFLRKLAWWLIGRRIYEAVRPEVKRA